MLDEYVSTYITNKLDISRDKVLKINKEDSTIIISKLLKFEYYQIKNNLKIEELGNRIPLTLKEIKIFLFLYGNVKIFELIVKF